MKKRGWILILLVLLLGLSVCIVAACGSDGSKKETITGFDDIPAQETVVYGTVYTVKSPIVKNESGDVLAVEVSVTCAGKPVGLVSNQFQINSMDDFSVVYTVRVSSDDVRTKTTVLKVEDKGVPYITIGDFEKNLITGAEWSADDLPEITVADDVDEDLTPTVKILLGDQELLPQEGKYVFSPKGAYTLQVTATDSSGNVGQAVTDIYVRDEPELGEVESFSDDFGVFYGMSIDDRGAVKTGYTQEEIGGRTPEDGHYFGWFSSEYEDGGRAEYPGFNILPRISKEDLLRLAAGPGYTGVRIRLYLDCETDHYLYHQWNGQKNLGILPANQWTEITAYIEDFIFGYDLVQSGEKQMFMVGNDPLYITSNDFTVYVEGVWLVRNAVLSFGSDFSLDRVYEGETLSMADTDMVALVGNKPVEDADYLFTLTAPDGSVTTADLAGKFELEKTGMYTLTAEIVNERTLQGKLSVTFFVSPSLESFMGEVERVKAIADKTTAEFQKELAALSALYDNLAADDKAEYSRIDLMKDVLGDFEEIENRVLYADSLKGILQIKTGETNTGTGAMLIPAAFTGESGFSTEVKYDDDSEGSFFMRATGDKVYLLVSLSGASATLGDLSNYQELRLRVYMNVNASHGGAGNNFGVRLLGWENNAAVLQDYGNAGDVMDEGEWHEVVIPLDKFSSWSEIALGFRDGNWNFLTAGSEVYIDSVYAIAKSSMSFDNAFLNDPSLSQGAELDLTTMAANVSYKNQTYNGDVVYKVIKPDASEQILTQEGSFTFADAGEYTFIATCTLPDGTVLTAERTVNVFAAVDMSVEEFNALINAMFEMPDKAGSSYKESADRLYSAYLNMTKEERMQINRTDYALALDGQTPQDDVVVYMNSKAAATQIEAQGTHPKTGIYGEHKNSQYIPYDMGIKEEVVTDIPEGLTDQSVDAVMRYTAPRDLLWVSLRLDGTASSLKPIGRYKAIEFWFYAPSANAASAYAMRTYDHGWSIKGATQTIEGGKWVKVTMPLGSGTGSDWKCYFKGWNDIRISFANSDWTLAVQGDMFYMSAVKAIAREDAGATVELSEKVSGSYNAGSLLSDIVKPLAFGADGTLAAGTSFTYTVAKDGGAASAAATDTQLTDVGKYVVTVTAADGAAQGKTCSATFYISVAEELVVFQAENIKLAAGAAGGVVSTFEGTVGGREGLFTTIRPKDETSTYPALRITPSISKADLLYWYEQGYTDLVVDVYRDASDETRNHTLGMNTWMGAQIGGFGSGQEGWRTARYANVVQALILNYDWISPDGNYYNFVFVGNDPADAELTVYLGDVRLAKPE